MKKRLIALLCIFVLAATWLAGCSSADTTTGQTTDNAPQTDTSNSDQEAAPAAESISFPLEETYTITAFCLLQHRPGAGQIPLYADDGGKDQHPLGYDHGQRG